MGKKGSVQKSFCGPKNEVQWIEYMPAWVRPWTRRKQDMNPKYLFDLFYFIRLRYFWIYDIYLNYAALVLHSKSYERKM